MIAGKINSKIRKYQEDGIRLITGDGFHLMMAAWVFSERKDSIDHVTQIPREREIVYFSVSEVCQYFHDIVYKVTPYLWASVTEPHNVSG